MGCPSTQKEAQNIMLPSVSDLRRLRSISVRLTSGTWRYVTLLQMQQQQQQQGQMVVSCLPGTCWHSNKHRLCR
jgi:hypothetical protein